MWGASASCVVAQLFSHRVAAHLRLSTDLSVISTKPPSQHLTRPKSRASLISIKVRQALTHTRNSNSDRFQLRVTTMASGTNRTERVIHQDFIARIRFSNALPPPPVPPKLLDVPNTGLASGQYTNPGFASRLAREQPLNIEVDAELGMPLDLVGMPGVFDGDESCE